MRLSENRIPIKKNKCFFTFFFQKYSIFILPESRIILSLY
jgi:hypothetical protein